MLADELHEFAAIVRCGGVSAAAGELGLSQSSVSRHLARLERELGVTLLARGAEGMRLTDAGRHVFLCALEADEAVDDLMAELGGDARGLR